MRELEHLGKLLLFLGFFLILAGLMVMLFGYLFRDQSFRLLPGDIFFKRGNFTFFFPIVTSLILSLVLTVVLNLVFWFLSRK